MQLKIVIIHVKYGLKLKIITYLFLNIDGMFNNFGHLQLFKYELKLHATEIFIKIKFLQSRINVTAKEESNPNRLDQMIEQNIAKT